MDAINDKLRLHRLVQNSVFAILLIFLVALLSYLAWQTRIQWDISQNASNSLSQASVEVLERINGPLEVTVYATSQDAQLGNVAKIIRNFLAPYQRSKPDFNVTFIDPAEQPKLAHEAGVQTNGEMVVEFKGKRERLTTFNEQALTNLLMRLARPKVKKVMALSGHGERKLDGVASRDLGEFGKRLATRGFKMETLNFAIARDVPADTSLLIISSPQVDLPEGVVEKLLAYIENGGNLLWLLDQEPLHGLQSLAEKLELTLTPGVVIDPQAQQLKVPITFSVGANYGQHPVTHNFDYITVFPFARQITVNDNEEWRSVSLVEVAENGWVEAGKLDESIAFDTMYDVPGPVSIAATLSRSVDDRDQRIAVIGSGYFLANAYLGQGNNLDFGVNLINWLADDEELIAIQPRPTLDSSLTLHESALTIIAWSFLIVMPLIFTSSGIIIWWKRRRK
jgi:ABC-type uncharacterized transport system involved in gliding motility auxiliary subunit